MVKVIGYGSQIVVHPGRRLMVVDYDNPADIGGNPDGASSSPGSSTYSDAWTELPLHRADVVDEISGDDALAALLASL
jgi:hypothetical protein